MPRKGQPGGVHYRHWLGIVQVDNQGSGNSAQVRMPARVVKEFWDRQFKWPDLHSLFRQSPRLWAFAYDMDNMKARCWYEATMPLLQISDDIRSEYEAIVAQLIRTAVLIAGNVRRSIKKALFQRPSEAKGDFSHIDARFWQTTESAFYSLLEQCRQKLSSGDDLTPLKMEWLKTLAVAGERIFDDLSQSNQFGVVDPKRIALAARDLRYFNGPGNKKIRQLLDLPKGNR